jgi:hypothetical protein
VLRFLSDVGYPSSNQAERNSRPMKAQQKISGCLRTRQATRHSYAIWGYISTAAKHGSSAFTAVRDALTETPGCGQFTPAPELCLQAVAGATQPNAPHKPDLNA